MLWMVLFLPKVLGRVSAKNPYLYYCIQASQFYLFSFFSWCTIIAFPVQHTCWAELTPLSLELGRRQALLSPRTSRTRALCRLWLRRWRARTSRWTCLWTTPGCVAPGPLPTPPWRTGEARASTKRCMLQASYTPRFAYLADLSCDFTVCCVYACLRGWGGWTPSTCACIPKELPCLGWCWSACSLDVAFGSVSMAHSRCCSWC